MLARLLTPIARRMLQPPYRPPRALRPELASRARDVTIPGPVLPLKAWLVTPEAAPRGTVLLVHGWSSDGGRMASLAAPLVSRGFAALLVDLPGHGRTGPVEMYNGKLMVDDIAVVAGWMAANEEAAPRPWAILGYSFGGLGAYVSAARDPRWSALVLLAAPIGAMEATKLYFDGLGLPGSFLIRMLRPSFARLVGVDPDTYDGPRNLPSVGVPVMIVHGDDDRVVPVSHAEGLAASVAGGLGTLVRVPGADHNELMTDETVGRRIADFLAEKLERRT
jgi:pimeloyl-ACP methyl ester carboxylesterase